MKKFDIKIPKQTWNQIRSKYPADSEFVQDDDFTAGTKNLDTTVKGVVTKRLGGVPYNPVLLAAPVKDQYEGIFGDGVRHLLALQSGEFKFSSGDQVFNTVVNGTGFVASGNFEFATINNKIYGGNGINLPQVYDRTTSYGGVAYSAPQLKAMGAQAPTSPPTLDSQTGSGDVPTGSYRYKYTFLYYGAEESNGSPQIAAPVVSGGSGSDITLDIPTGGYGVTGRGVYRALEGTEDYLLVGFISENTSSAANFVDDQPAGTFTIPLESDVPPIFGFIALYQDAAWLSVIQGEPFTLRYSNNGQPDLVPAKNFLLCNQEDPIVAHVIFKGRLIVLNRNSMGQVLGTTFFNYKYEDIQGSVGCVDARSVQVRTIRGIPTLIWLSDKGIYTYNGNSIDYISDPIEDLVNFNIQQAQFNKQKDETSSEAEFNGLIRSDGILVNGNQLTTITPRQLFSSQADWDGGVVADLATSQGDNTIKTITEKVIDITEGGNSLSGLSLEGGEIRLPTNGVHPSSRTLADDGNFAFASQVFGFNLLAQQIIISEAGQITSVTMDFLKQSLAVDYTFSVRSDLGDNPAGTLFTENITVPSGSGIFSKTFATGVDVQAEKVWVVVDVTNTNGLPVANLPVRLNTGGFNDIGLLKILINGTFTTEVNIAGGPDAGDTAKSLPFSYNFSQTVVPKIGTFVSTEKDSESIYITGQMKYTHSIDLNATFSGVPTSNTVQIQGSNSEFIPRSWVTVETLNNPSSGDFLFTPVTPYRYWRVIVVLETPDNRDEPSNNSIEGTPRFFGGTLEFPQSGTWESQPIFTSDDVTSFDSLIDNSTIPAQSVLEIATAPAEGGPYTAFTSIGAATPDKYAKVRLTLNTVSNAIPIVGQVTFDWAISSTAEIDITNPINAGLDIAGWDIFLASFADNGGTSLFEMRSATTAPGLSGEGYVTILPPNFPTGVAVNQFGQWRVTLTASAANVPTVNTVTTQWFVGTIDSIRVASLFFNRTYYLVAAKFGSTVNNVLIVFDGENKFRLYEDLNINTLGLFFNDPYFGSAIDGRVVKFLEGILDNNSDNIELDLRTRAFDLSRRAPADSDKIKLLKQVEVRVKNTGAKIQGFYSVDEGLTFNPLFGDDGNDFYQTDSSGTLVTIRFRVKYDGSSPLPGKTVMVRLLSNDEKEVQIHNIRLKGFIREADVINIAQ